jgi:hypothetical protein
VNAGAAPLYVAGRGGKRAFLTAFIAAMVRKGYYFQNELSIVLPKAIFGVNLGNEGVTQFLHNPVVH